MTEAQANPGFEVFKHVGIAVDPIHVGTGGARLGRVDLSIVRDPVTRVPKIPGSSLAGVYRTYVAMAQEIKNPDRTVEGNRKPYYPDCAGLGQGRSDGSGGHCGQPDCPLCTAFGFARGSLGGFAGLAAFSDAQVLLFPVATREGPVWVASPMTLSLIGLEASGIDEVAIYRMNPGEARLNLGWLYLPVRQYPEAEEAKEKLGSLRVPDYILGRLAIVADALLSHVVNSNLEVRTSVSIDPDTGAAQDGALFTYEALPRATVLYWEVVCKDPKYFRVGGRVLGFRTIADIHRVAIEAHPYLEQLGVGGMGTRGMGRLKVLYPS